MVLPLRADTTINDADKFAYSANVGWVNWQADTSNGAAMGPYFATGYIYSANTGWICMGMGPTNNCNYSNASSNDWGVNVLPGGTLRGFAYGANIGWINFEATGNAKIDLLTGNFSGSAYGANVGWITLSNNVVNGFVKTDTLDSGPNTDGDMLPDLWELKYATNLTVLGSGDADSDGVTDLDEYYADTDPDDSGDFLRITSFSVLPGTSETSTVTWASKETRLYQLQEAVNLEAFPAFADSGLGTFLPDAGSITARDVISTSLFYRVEAVLPLAP